MSTEQAGQTQARVTLEDLDRRISVIEKLLKAIGGLSGISFVVIVAFAFWLGKVDTKVSSSADTINQVYGTVSNSDDSLQVRTKLMQKDLASIDRRLTSMDENLANMRAELARLQLVKTSVTVKPLPNQ